MKAVLLSSLAALLFITVLYLVGAFIAMDFNPAQWDAAGRSMMGIFGLFISGIIFFAVLKEVG